MRGAIAVLLVASCGRIDIDPLVRTDARQVDAPMLDAADAYAAAVLGDQPFLYYRFDETSGTVAHDSSASGIDGVVGSSIELGVPGLLVGDPSTAIAIAAGAPRANANV